MKIWINLFKPIHFNDWTPVSDTKLRARIYVLKQLLFSGSSMSQIYFELVSISKIEVWISEVFRNLQ